MKEKKGRNIKWERRDEGGNMGKEGRESNRGEETAHLPFSSWAFDSRLGLALCLALEQTLSLHKRAKRCVRTGKGSALQQTMSKTDQARHLLNSPSGQLPGAHRTHCHVGSTQPWWQTWSQRCCTSSRWSQKVTHQRGRVRRSHSCTWQPQSWSGLRRCNADSARLCSPRTSRLGHPLAHWSGRP